MCIRDRFSGMLEQAAREFVQYIMHIEVKIEADEEEAPVTTDMQTSGPTSPLDGSALVDARAEAAKARKIDEAGKAAAEDTGLKKVRENRTDKVEQVVRSDEEKTPRNAPCPCGSGKKFKQCHGR